MVGLLTERAIGDSSWRDTSHSDEMLFMLVLESGTYVGSNPSHLFKLHLSLQPIN